MVQSKRTLAERRAVRDVGLRIQRSLMLRKAATAYFGLILREVGGIAEAALQLAGAARLRGAACFHRETAVAAATG